MSGKIRCPVPDSNAKALPAPATSPLRAAVTAVASLRSPWKPRLAGVGLAFLILLLCLGASSLPLLADGAPAPPPGTGGEDFGQYLADHQGDLAPFFQQNAGRLFKLGVPLLMAMMGWVVLFTLLAGWAIDVILSRGFAMVFAPAFIGMKRCLIYATGGLCLSFVYVCLLGIAMIFSQKMPHGGIVLAGMLVLLFLVAVAAQIVWVISIYRTTFGVSAGFYLGLIVVHALVGVLIAASIVNWRASSVATDFVDQQITPGLRAEAESTKRELAAIDSSRNTSRTKVADLRNQLAQAQTEADQLRQEIVEKKNSDIYVLSEILRARARDDLDAARDQLTGFVAKFPSSPLNPAARAQLAEVDGQLAAEAAEKKQGDAEAARAAAQARASLLARAAKGDVTLSEMRQALIGKTRAQVTSMLGLPSETASNTWGYRQQMIVNPLTNERHGLMVYFAEGMVQSVDYNRNGGSP
jgi:hypothetical protein